MTVLANIFWNSQEKRIRAFFRIVLFVVLAGLFATIIAMILNNVSELFEKTFTNFLVMLAILLAIYLAGIYFDKRKWGDFGITLIPLKSFVHGAMWGSLLIIVIFLIQSSLGWLILNEIQFNTFPTHAFLLVFVGQVFRYLCGSIFEEAFSRGYLLVNLAEGFQGRLSNRYAVLLSYFITSSLFGLLHIANENASLLSSINLVLIGLLLGWMVVKTGKLHFSIGLHAAWNVFQNNVFGFANSGKKSIVSLYTFENSGSTLWTGGEFGIEGGLLCTITVSIALVVLSQGQIFRITRLKQNIL
ncbi:lysostaphin resistance A-like protein [Flagellimonas sp.]|uniref:CPBP family intramembrane glutamic endopeptidase n=1 Tax=Flagellimonas sp. TaxID=2058762 RepID=UPI003F4A2AF6